MLDSIVSNYDEMDASNLKAISNNSALDAVKDQLNKPQALNKFEEMKDKYSVCIRPKMEEEH